MALEITLNRMFVELYQEIMDAEEKALIVDEFSDITINDMHVIEAIGCDEPRSSSVVAGKLGITMGTLTKAIDGLTRKEYVVRERSDSDKRVVLLSLTGKGVKAFEHHAAFHRGMVEAVMAQLEPEEKKVLDKSLGNLMNFFAQAGRAQV